MEKALSKLFDYQKFERDRKLQSAISSVRKPARELSLEEASLVSAAGSAHFQPSGDDRKERLS